MSFVLLHIDPQILCSVYVSVGEQGRKRQGHLTYLVSQKALILQAFVCQHKFL